MNEEQEEDRDRRAVTLAVLVLISTISPFTVNIILPSLPLLEVQLPASRAEVALLLSTFLGGMALAQLVIGPLADRFGRKPVIVIGLLLYVGASLGAVGAVSIGQLVLARVLQALGATVGLPLARTIVRDLYGRDRAAAMLGYVTMGMVIGPMVSPAIGGFLHTLIGWQSIFLICAILGAVTLVAVVTALPETRPAAIENTTTREVWTRSKDLLVNRRFIAFLWVIAPTSAMFWAFQGATPYLVIDVMGTDKTVYALWFMVGAFGYMLGNFVSGRLSERVGGERMIAIGGLLGLAGAGLIIGLALMGVLHPLALFGPVVVMAIGNGMVLPNAIAGAVSVDPRAAGAASGLLGFLQTGLSAIVSWVSGLVSTSSAIPLGALMTILAIMAILASRATTARGS